MTKFNSPARAILPADTVARLVLVQLSNGYPYISRWKRAPHVRYRRRTHGYGGGEPPAHPQRESAVKKGKIGGAFPSRFRKRNFTTQGRNCGGAPSTRPRHRCYCFCCCAVSVAAAAAVANATASVAAATYGYTLYRRETPAKTLFLYLSTPSICRVKEGGRGSV